MYTIFLYFYKYIFHYTLKNMLRIILKWLQSVYFSYI